MDNVNSFLTIHGEFLLIFALFMDNATLSMNSELLHG